MSKELDELRTKMAAELTAEKTATGKQLEMANAVYRAAEEKIKVAREEFAEAARLLSSALKADMDASKELRKMQGTSPAYTKSAKPQVPAKPKAIPAHRRIVRARAPMPKAPEAK